MNNLIQPTGSVSTENNKQSIARIYGCDQSEIEYLKTGLDLSLYKILYDKTTQSSFEVDGNLGVIASFTISGYKCTIITSTGLSINLYKLKNLNNLISYVTPEMFGATGDGISDDSEYIQLALDWISNDNYRKIIFLGNKKYRTTKTLTVDFKNIYKGNIIQMDGPIYPDDAVKDALIINNALYSEFNLNVIGDGISDASLLPNYNLPDPENCRQAFVINSARACKIKCLGYAYSGRVLRTKSTLTTKLSFLNIDIRTGESSCAQAMYLQGADSAYGVISSAQTQWDIYGSVLDSITDITINYWEYGASSINAFNPALTLKKISSAHIDVLAGGQGSGNGTALKIEGGVAITINKLFTTQCNVGLHVVGGTPGTSELNKQLYIGSHYSYGSNHASCILENVYNVSINDLHYDSVGDYGIIFTGTCRDIRLNGYIRNPNINCIYADNTSNLHRIFISGRLYSASNKNLIDFTLSSIQYILFDNVTAVSTGGRLMDLPSNNNVNISGGGWETTGGTLWNIRPAKIENTYSPIVESRGSSNFPAGSTSGASITISHGCGVQPTDIDLRWVQIPSIGSQLILTNTTDTNFTVTLIASTPLSVQVNFRWFANSHIK